jgi:SAM-dependent methyltransferase
MESDRKEREAQFHDEAVSGQVRRRLWDTYYAVAGAPNDHYDDRIAALSRGATALEYGCGAGGRSEKLAEGAAHVDGIDISPEAIRVATEHARERGYADRVDYRVMDAETLSYEDDRFDLVCGTSILHHLELETALPEIARVLKPDGRALFLEPLGHNPAINLYRRLTPRLRTVDEHPFHLSELDATGEHFGSVEIDYFTLLPLAAVPLRRLSSFGRIIKRLDAADRRLFKAIPPSRRLAWQVVIELAGPSQSV